jgi:hypothetical protein
LKFKAVANFPNSLLLDDVVAGALPSSFPPGKYHPTTMSAVGFVDYAGGNDRLAATSPYRGGATDGTDVGCKLDLVNLLAGSND